MLEARVAALVTSQSNQQTADSRRAMVGSGMRGDKVRTYREQDDQVTDHRTGKQCRLQDMRAGRLELLR